MMPRFLQQLVVIAYLVVTFCALVFSLTKIVFLLPEPVIHWSYGMMAPYQGDRTWNADFLYEGQLPDGTWHAIDIAYYMPYGFAERNVREFLRVYEGLGTLTQREKFSEFALMLLDRERARGHPYRSVRITYEQWDRSPAGYEFLHTPLFTTREFVTQVP